MNKSKINRSDYMKKYRPIYYKINRERILKKTSEYYFSHRLERLDYAKNYKQKNIERIHERDRKYYLKNKERLKKYYKEWRLKRGKQKQTERQKQQQIEYKKTFPEKVKCHQIFRNFLRQGKVKRPESCSNCGNPSAVQAHHPDYNFPLNIIWLCSSCHKEEHNRIKLLETIPENSCL